MRRPGVDTVDSVKTMLCFGACMAKVDEGMVVKVRWRGLVK
uniref:Uncharacterized protein n=1 Tax=Dikerogammarus haemobaphes virus 1 TaxID=2704946 RepID=A0A6G9HE52_9VIRU|nr:hypothetical protein [Dikerogammarus haemobaphes virus 1]